MVNVANEVETDVCVRVGLISVKSYSIPQRDVRRCEEATGQTKI